MKTRGREQGLVPPKLLPRGREGGFTLVEVVIALAIIALTAIVLLDRRVEIVRDAGRSREVRIAWFLASQKMAELELDKSLWQGQGGQSSGDFGEIDAAYATFTWEYLAQRVPVETVDPQTVATPQKPREVFRLELKVAAASLPEPVVIEAMFPVPESKPAGTPPPGGPPGPGAPGPGTPAPPGGGKQ